MAIWNEIKTFINSDPEAKPINETIGTSEDGSTLMDKLDTINELVSNIAESGGGIGNGYSKNDVDLLLEDKVDKITGMSLTDNNFTDYYKKKLDGIEPNANYFNLTKLENVNIATFATDANHRTVTETEKSKWSDKYTKSEIDGMIDSLPLGLIWKDSVSTYQDILTTYPEPENNWTVSISDGSIYTFNGTWIKINISTVPPVSTTNNGLMTSSLYEKLNGIAENANDFRISDVSADDIKDGTDKVMMTLDERIQLEDIPDLYRDVNTKIVEGDLDESLLNKFMTRDSGLLDDTTQSQIRTYSSAKIESLFNSLKQDRLTNSEMDAWFM